MKTNKHINGYPFIPYAKESFSPTEIKEKSSSFYEWMDTRRSCRDFSKKAIPKEVIENIILTASTAPSGASG